MINLEVPIRPSTRVENHSLSRALDAPNNIKYIYILYVKLNTLCLKIKHK